MNSMDVSRQRSNILIAHSDGFECPEAEIGQFQKIDLCNKYFATISAWRKHLKTHAENGAVRTPSAENMKVGLERVFAPANDRKGSLR
jgi:hypothetical protein